MSISKDGICYSGGTYENEDLAGFASEQLTKELYREDAHLNNVQLEGYVFVNRRAEFVKDSVECLSFKTIKIN